MTDNQKAAAFASSEAVDHLAKRLYTQLDPVEGEPESEWSALPDDDRHYYRQLIEDLVSSPDFALAALSAQSNADRRTGSPMARRRPRLLLLLGVLLVAAVGGGGFVVGFNVVEDHVRAFLGELIVALSRC